MDKQHDTTWQVEKNFNELTDYFTGCRTIINMGIRNKKPVDRDMWKIDRVERFLSTS